MRGISVSSKEPLQKEMYPHIELNKSITSCHVAPFDVRASRSMMFLIHTVDRGNLTATTMTGTM